MAPENHSRENVTNSQVAVVLVPLPAQGHLNQLLHLSHLISATNLPVYYVATATHLRQAKLRLHGWDPSSISNLHFHELPTPQFQNPQPDPHATIKFPSQIIPSFFATMHLRQPVYSFAYELSNKFRRVVVIYDAVVASVVQDVDSLPNCESYCFRISSAFYVCSSFWEAAGKPDIIPADAEEILREIPSLDGCFTPEFSEFVKSQRGFKKTFSGDIYNTSREIEGTYLDLLGREKLTGTDKVWALGPFHLVTDKKGLESAGTCHRCLDWLDRQEEDSVIFVSFGTTCSLSDEQIKELAIGLENSHKKFVWSLRDADKGDIFSGEARKPELPQGFEERVKERGIVLRDWAPQLEILRHRSTGGFMSHCGWNSCIESISMGVAIAAWPMHSDQPRNAFLVTKVLKIGVEVNTWERHDELVSSGTVEEVVRRLMASEEGDEIRRRAQELGVSVRCSVMEGGGRCNKEMDSFITHITR